jgi:asparagine synthase (glutamine-hydrolysing)
MCGILGFASNVAINESEKLLQSIDLLDHRGPDDVGKWVSNNRCVAFAHKRLSIIDLSKNGHQPMKDNSERYVIVFNGEIYNYLDLFKTLKNKGHRFNSKTDTEVILAAYCEWGESCVSFLNGMFAFAIYDSLKNTIFVSRDRAGEKPLYYCIENGIFQFSSELKALLSTTNSPRKLNSNSLDCFLSMGFTPGERCILDGYNKLPAASSLVFDLNTKKIKVWKYWEVPTNNLSSSDSFNESDLIDRLESLLEKSVNQQLVADVPIGVLLSGGLDSSLITAMAVRKISNVKTFTIRFPDAGKLDETEHARMISRYFETEHIELEAKPSSVDLLTKLAIQFDEPIIDSSMIPTFLVSKLVKKHCKVALGGDGGDELFGGYKHYSRLIWMKKYLGLMPQPLLKSVSYFSEKTLPLGIKGKNWLQSLNTDLNHGVPLIANYFDPSARRKLMKGFYNDWPTVAEDILQSRLLQSQDLLDRASRMDFTNFLTEDILVKVDRASMLNSLEIRSPFLDKHLVEFAFSEVPSSLKASSSDKKILLKKLANKVLPHEFDKHRKQGFSIPINNWLNEGKFRDFFYDVLLDSKTIFDKDSINILLKGQDKGRNNGERLFALVMFELWRREYRVSF